MAIAYWSLGVQSITSREPAAASEIGSFGVMPDKLGCFNGAAPVRARIVNAAKEQFRALLASMEPRRLGRG